jgi:hypothetical protein
VGLVGLASKIGLAVGEGEGPNLGGGPLTGFLRGVGAGVGFEPPAFGGGFLVIGSPVGFLLGPFAFGLAGLHR